MSSKSNDRGRAFEYACLINLAEQISKFRTCAIKQNSSLEVAKRAWDTLNQEEKEIYHKSSLTAVSQIFEMEPRINEATDDILDILIQADAKGETGDVRDILIIRKDISWEIGFSLKHNHFAVKHSRLSSRLDFGKSWFGISCSQRYWEAVEPIFNYLSEKKDLRLKFSELPDKENNIYIPLLQAFINEIVLQNELHPNLPAKLVEYLLGKFDFYKIISIDREKVTRIQGINMHGTLNQPAQERKAEIEVPLVSLPTRIALIQFVPGRNNTVEIYMDKGWQFTFRIHNASTFVEPSLKFDIQIVGMPTAIFTINCLWK